MFLTCDNGLISAIFLRNLCVQKTKPVRSLRNLCVTIDQCVSGVLKVRFLFYETQLVRTNFLYPYQMLSFYEIKSFTRALRNTDHEVSVPKCPGKWLYFINQGQLFQINYINTGLLHYCIEIGIVRLEM